MYYSGNRYLSLEEMQVNALFIRNYLITRGWTVNAISGLLGNAQTESTINPSIWQSFDTGNTSLGYGLVQWTPATKYLDWCADTGRNPELMESNLDRLFYEIDNNIQWIATDTYNFSFAEFMISTAPPAYLGKAFLANYERPKEPKPDVRGAQSEYWYSYLTGEVPPVNPEEPSEPKTHRKLPIWMMLRPY